MKVLVVLIYLNGFSYAATELVTRAIKVMMESGCEEVILWKIMNGQITVIMIFAVGESLGALCIVYTALTLRTLPLGAALYYNLICIL